MIFCMTSLNTICQNMKLKLVKNDKKFVKILELLGDRSEVCVSVYTLSISSIHICIRRQFQILLHFAFLNTLYFIMISRIFSEHFGTELRIVLVVLYKIGEYPHHLIYLKKLIKHLANSTPLNWLTFNSIILNLECKITFGCKAVHYKCHKIAIFLFFEFGIFHLKIGEMLTFAIGTMTQ